MRCRIQEQRYECGDYLDVNIYPAFRKAGHRRAKYKPSSETQANLNARNAAKRMERIIHANFTRKDIKAELTYAPENEPADEKEAQKRFAAFLRRVKRWRANNGMSALKYVYVIERGTRSGRIHHHVIMSGIPVDALAELWREGYVEEVKPLQFGKTGVAGLVWYMNGNKHGQRVEKLCYRHYNSSRNLIIPKPTVKTGRLSQKRCRELALFDYANRQAFEELYPDYYFGDCVPFMNDKNGGVYINVRMYRKDASIVSFA